MVAAVVCYGLAAQSQTGWLYIVLAMVAGAVPIGIFYPLLAVRGLRATATLNQVTHSVQEGETLVVTIVVSNPTNLPRYWLVLTDCSDITVPQGRGMSRFIPSIPAHGVIKLTWSALCDRRGIFTVPSLHVATAAPFGLVRADAPLAVARQEIIVFPRWWTLPGADIASNGAGDAAAQRPTTQGSEFFGTRPYRVGDSLRRVHWRSTARHDSLIVREMEEPTRRALTIILDAAISSERLADMRIPDRAGATHPGGHDARATFDVAVRLAASATHWAIAGDVTACFLTNSQSPAGTGTITSWERHLHDLARIEQTAGLPPISAMLATLPTTPVMLVILPAGAATAGSLDAVIDPLLAMRRHGAKVTVAMGAPEHDRTLPWITSFHETLEAAGVRVVAFSSEDLEVMTPLC